MTARVAQLLVMVVALALIGSDEAALRRGGEEEATAEPEERHTQRAWKERRQMQSGGCSGPGCPTRPPESAPPPSVAVVVEPDACPEANITSGANDNVYMLQCVPVVSGLWMCTSWSTVSAAGVFIARYCRKYPWWIDWHIRLQAVGAMGTVGFVAVAISMVHEQLAGTHQIMGSIFGIFTLLQVSSGEFVHNWTSAERRHHGLVTMFHKTMGKLSLIIAAVNIVGGFDLMISSRRVEPWLRYVWGVWAVALAAVFAVAECMYKKQMGGLGEVKAREEDYMENPVGCEEEKIPHE